MRLTQRNCCRANAEVQQPGYDRSRLSRGVLHLGLGAFHRAHQALYTEAAIHAGDSRWGIVGVSLREPRTPRTLAAQDFLYSVTECEGAAATTRVVGAVVQAWYAPHALEEVLGALADPGIAVVTCTVTEKGYCLHPSSADLDTQHPDIRHDLAHRDAPRSTLGVLAAGLRRRPAGAPLSIVCCDNMPTNGDTLRKLLGQYAALKDPVLARRVRDDVTFPNTMVDRIVPAATPASRRDAQRRLGLRDEAAIVCEAFTQWVIEDRFAGPRPAWEAGGALLTGDVRPFQAMKLQLLNGTHSAIAYAGQLCGLQTVAEAMDDPLVGAFARGVMADLRATVQAPPGYDVAAYSEALLQRFRNAALDHRTAQIAADGTQKVPLRWLPALRESLAAGVARPCLERALALWLHYLRCDTNQHGEPLAASDPGAPPLAAALRGAHDDTDAIHQALAHGAVFGEAPWPKQFQLRLAAHLTVLRERGAAALMSFTATT
ncbi:Putative Mannitol dehydrogenase (Fructuronate reductase) [Cupriavidus phytorum]|uniref:Mannitol dehydrogenase (Fructuronate reductase) n=2 Tax=Cupriavidus TaxID=106589 RepID=A0A976A4R4_9BURK|nr:MULTISPECIES: mannitol dehydrogenase family protein [Cupriavidus]PZX23105.1 fructuronate reductase [Cupriavidus alkaliphilus]SOY60909.1 Putative Mannitol dehydrogenase (Fructuronate reductase) [Cupriavidus taiwanensis]